MTTPDATRIADPGGDQLVLRSAVAAARVDMGLAIADPHGLRTVTPPWPVWRHELSPDGALLLAIGDEGRRGQIWSTATGALLLELVGSSADYHCLRAGIAEIDGHGYALTDTKRGVLSVLGLDGGERVAWLNLNGLTTFRVNRVVPLEVGWIALHGSRFAEQYYTVAIVPAHEVLTDTEALQSVLLERPAPWWWGYQVAIGPAGAGQAVIVRDPKWEEDDGEPEWEDEDLRGFLFWDFMERRVVDRLRWSGAIPNGGTLGADRDRIAIERVGVVEVVDRKSGESHLTSALALDPYRLTIARRDGHGLVIEPLV